MMRLVKHGYSHGIKFYHFEDKEKKDEYCKEIKTENKDKQFKSKYLGEPWKEDEEVEC